MKSAEKKQVHQWHYLFCSVYIHYQQLLALAPQAASGPISAWSLQGLFKQGCWSYCGSWQPAAQGLGFVQPEPVFQATWTGGGYHCVMPGACPPLSNRALAKFPPHTHFINKWSSWWCNQQIRVQLTFRQSSAMLSLTLSELLLHNTTPQAPSQCCLKLKPSTWFLVWRRKTRVMIYGAHALSIHGSIHQWPLPWTLHACSCHCHGLCVPVVTTAMDTACL